MASGPITSWQIDGETVETVSDFFFWGGGGLQNHCRWWLQPWNWKTLTPWKKSYDQSRQQLKSSDITLPTKVHLVKALVFPVVMHWCEAWFIKKAEHCRIDAFWLRCWRRLLRVPWTTRRSNQSILKEINPEYSLERHAEAETWIFWPPDVKSCLIGKNPDAGKDWKKEEKWRTEDEMVGWQHCLKGHEFEQTPGDSEGPGSLVCCSPRDHKELTH